ncbi:hypothetical protein QBC47DRAFT_30300 [Echria macrotheca]|uniref:Transport protein USO1 n=1 Tax=Echria macrotheca TaxID=438768 RepID=A0AAJ0BNM5_9PEZI|nr:hypothetical protein QBC47DRAFT_30300 [Echria macrotheca]
MPTFERDLPRDMERSIRHQHSASSDHGRALVPMWDSSDPERAPPPLPLNPQSPSVVSRAGTSSAIQSAHAALTEKARENALVPHLPKRMTDTSPERSLLRGSTHRRMNSVQPASVKDMSLMIESSRDSTTPKSPEKSERPSTPSRGRSDPFNDFKINEGDKVTISSPIPGPSLTPIIRPTVRRPHQSILGENTPPQSATMLALQNMSTNSPNPATPKEPETPLANITNSSTALVKVPQSLEALSNQILTLTSIATTLQKEMSQLSRRSRDNATDLLSLKEATSARDEDIRKSLRELITDAKSRASSRDQYGGPLLLEGRHHPSSPTTLSKTVRPFSLPRIPSPNSFAASLDRESLLSTPSLVGDSPTTIALLEKIIRDMSTREGQDMLLTRLTELSERLSGLAAADKVDELVRIVKSTQQQAVVPSTGGTGGGGNGGGNRARNWSFSDDEEPKRRELDFNDAGTYISRAGRLLQDKDARRSSAPSGQATEVINEDVLKAIRTVKDSVAQGGGLTAEVKALVRELRGEVLGMGREIGRRLDEVVAKNAASGKPDAAGRAEMTRIVEQGLAEMKQQMDGVLREHRRQSSATTMSRDTLVDYKEIYNSMRAALKDSQANKPRGPELRREDVVQAVKDAWEKYKPEIEIQQIGLERDEILECLKQGLRDYAPRDDRPPGATRDEVFKAVIEGLKHFVPPQVDTPASLSRDEILEAVRECLEEFEFPVAPSALGQELSKDDMLDAVKEGLHSFDFPTPPPPPPPGPDLTRSDVLAAVNEGLHSFDFSAVQSSALVPQALTKTDVSEAVKQGLKSLDLGPELQEAVRDGVNSLDLATDVHVAVGAALKSFDFASIYASALVPRSDLSRVDVADAIKDGLDSLDISGEVKAVVVEALKSFDFSSVYSSALIPRPEISRVDVADAVKDGLESLDITSGMESAVKRGLESFDFSAVPSSALVARSDLSRVDVADAVKEGLESLDLSGDVVRAVHEGLKACNMPTVPSPSSALVPLSGDNDRIVKGLHELKEYLELQFQAVSDEAKQNVAANGRDTEQVLDATKDGFDKLRQDMEVYIDRARGDSDPGESMAHLVRTLEGFREEIAELLMKSTDDSREQLREEIESLRDTVNSSLIPVIPQGGNSKEFIEVLQEGLSSLRTDISTRPLAGVSEIIDALQEGLGDIRCSIDRLHNKPADLTANDEILDALKTGLDTVRSDIDGLREESKNDRALATIDAENDKAVIPADPPLKHDDIKNLETLMTQLGAKVEALESAPPPVIESVSKEDLADIQEKLHTVAQGVSEISHRDSLEALTSLEERLKNVQDSIAELLAREPPAPAETPAPSSSDTATKEDVEAIETILRNTKARLDDFIDDEQSVKKDQIDMIETQILETRELLNKLSGAVELVSRKEDVTMVESLVTQIISSFDEMKERHEKALEDPERVTKTDVDAVEAICLDTKVVIEQMLKSDLNTVATKDDVMKLQTLLGEYQERVTAQAESDSKALEVRRAEMATVGERVAEVKTILEEFQGVARAKLEDGAKGVDAINGVLDAMSDTLRKNANISDELKEMFDTMKLEFEDSRAGVVGAKLETDEKFQMTVDTLTSKLDERMDELFEKYDAFQLLQEERAAKGEGRDEEMEAAVVGTKAIAEELRSLIDTLGTTVTDSLEKMEEASKTVFERVEDLFSKSEESHTEDKAEHQLTRDNFQEVIGKVDSLQGVVANSEPKILEAIQDVLLLVGQHYEHSKSSTLTIQDKIEEAKPPEQPLLPPPEKYDDTVVHEKLDKLVEHANVADKAFEHLSTLPSMHAVVKQTAAELAVFIAAQTQRIADEHEDREKTLQETILALERRLEEKQQVEAHLADLREEEARLKESVHVTLRAEHEQMKEQFLANLVEEEARLKAANESLREEQERLKETFIANLKEEQERLMEMNVSIKEEQDQLKEMFLLGLKEEQARLADVNDTLREEHQLLKDTLLANLREEEALLKEVNAGLRDEHERLKETFIANLKEEEERLKETNDKLRREQEELRAAWKEEQEQLKAALREEHERMKIELLANLLEEETRLKEANELLREEQNQAKDKFFASLREEEERWKDRIQGLRAEHDNLHTQKGRVLADLSATETALQIRREDVQYMEAKAEGLERRILEGVMDHSRVLLMAKQKRPSPRDSMSRKRVSSQKYADTATANPAPTANSKPRAALDIALSGKTNLNAPAQSGGSRRILSLSQITNNVPTGGLKRSQSVRTAGGPGRMRKGSWGGASRAAKGYGDLDREKDKENLELKESDEDDVNDAPHESENTPPVDIIISRADTLGPDTPVDDLSHEPTDDLMDDYDTVGLHEDKDGDSSDSGTLRRSSRGTTVMTSTESYGGTEYSDEDGDVDDAASDWTESAVGVETTHDSEPASLDQNGVVSLEA